jgi:signal peptidase I
MPIYEDTTTNRPRRREGWRSVLGTVSLLLTAPLIAVLLTMFGFQAYQVEGMSMEHSLQDKDRLVILKVPRTLSRITHHAYIPDRYDVIVFNSGVLGRQLIKRVIGLPGDRVVISAGKVTIFNKDHPSGFMPDAGQQYTAGLPETPGDVDVIVEDNEVFVLGDNRNNSEDSSEFGPISANDIIGKLVVRVLPLGNLKAF